MSSADHPPRSRGCRCSPYWRSGGLCSDRRPVGDPRGSSGSDGPTKSSVSVHLACRLGLGPLGPRQADTAIARSSLPARFSPWKIILTTLMLLYTVRHIDSIFGFGAPEPLARMYSRAFYRSTWVVTALDAGFATAMNVKPLWLRDILCAHEKGPVLTGGCGLSDPHPLP